MHVGNLRTALFAYLLAKSHGGSFILRIEDTDQERLVAGATDLIFRALHSTGLNWDEGPDIGGPVGPYVQSERLGLYKQYSEKLVELGAAYYCFCNKERLEEVRFLQKHSGSIFKYDGHCRDLQKDQIAENLGKGMPYVVRQRMPDTGRTTFADEVFGSIVVENETLDDQVLIKADGMPTYNFANVVDDHLMGITHVIRGSEYLSSTPKYNLLYVAFGWEVPKYIHCSPVMRNANEKLSKRKGDASFEDLIEQGYLKEAILNYIALLGWSPKTEQEFFLLDDLKKEFSVSGLSKSPAIFDIKKLNYINSKHIKAMPFESFFEKSLPFIQQAVKRTDIDLKLVAELLQSRTELLNDIPAQIDFIDAVPDYNPELFVNKKMKTTKETAREALLAVLPLLESVADYSLPGLRDVIMSYIAANNLKNGVVLWPLRVALTGKEHTPGGGIEIAAALGKQETIKRLRVALEKL
jgi:glutamyl-tRNA synthetase